MKTDKRRKQQFPTSFKTHDSFIKSKMNQFNYGLAAIAKINNGSSFLPKKVRVDLYSAKELLYNAASNLIVIYHKNIGEP